ncbi:MAG: DNA methyltransferase [Alphaproteobacteria bacterium]
MPTNDVKGPHRTDKESSPKKFLTVTAHNDFAVSPHNHPAIEMVRLSELKPMPGNPRQHTKHQKKTLKRLIKRMGFLGAILIDCQNHIIAGELRVECAADLGMDAVPAVRITHLSAAELRAFRIADNRIAELAEWDQKALAHEFAYLASVNFEVDLTGFELPEIDFVIQQANEEDDDPLDEVPEVDPDAAPVSRPGDLWLLDDHRLQCGNAVDRAAWNVLMGGEQAQMVFTDPPYNVPVRGHVSGLGRNTHREFSQASGEMADGEYISFLAHCLVKAVDHSSDGSLHFVCIDWRHYRHLLEASDHIYQDQLNLVVWNKTNGGMGSLYRSQHELIAVFKSGRAPHINNVQLGKHGRYRTNVWTYPGQNAFGAERDEALAAHPTVKPVPMVADAILDCSTRGSIIADPFIGSGTLFLAAEKTGRRGYGLEIDPLYVDVAVRRWQGATGGTARLRKTGQSFDEVAACRGPGGDPAPEPTTEPDADDDRGEGVPV